MNTAAPAVEAQHATRDLAAFSAGLAYDTLPNAVVDKAKLCVLDTLGCMLFGATLPWTKLVAELAQEEGGEAQAALVGLPGRATVSQAVMVNATSGHGFELDDAHTRASMHAGSIALATALAIGEWQGASGRDFVTALVAGYEAGLRVGIAGAGQIFRRGFHPSAVCGGFVAAATAARLLNLDAEKTQHAFGIVGSMASGLMSAQEGGMVKRLHSGQAARNGVTAALLARRGFTGIPNVLEAPFGGFFSAMTEKRNLAALTEGYGTQWETLAVGFKAYATAGACQPSLALLDGIMREHKLTADDIERVEVECTTHCKDHVAWPYVPQGVTSAQLNIYYALSVMALERAAMADQFAEEKLADPDFLEFMPRIFVKTNPKYDEMGVAFRYATRVTVTTRQGGKHTADTLYRPGSGEAPLKASQIEAKFDQLTARLMSDERRAAVKAAVRGLDGAKDVGALMRALSV